MTRTGPIYIPENILELALKTLEEPLSVLLKEQELMESQDYGGGPTFGVEEALALTEEDAEANRIRRGSDGD